MSQHGVERICNHGHDDIKVNLDQDGRGKGIEVEELDSLGDGIFHPPPSGVVSHEQFQGGSEVIGDEEGGLLMAVALNNHLAQFTLIVRQSDEGFVDHRIGVFPFTMGDVDAFPGVELPDTIQHVLAPASEGDEPDALLVELGEFGIGGELGVKDKGGLDSPLDLLPEGEKAQDLIIGFLPLNVGRCVKNQLGGGFLGKKGQSPFHPFVPGSGPVLLKHGFISKMGDRVEVQIDDPGIIEPELGRLFDKALLQSEEVDRIQAIGITGHGGALG